MKRSVLFGSLVAEGSRYQVGQAYAVQLRQNPLLRQINLLPEKEEVAGPALRAKMRLLEAAIPGLGEEIAGASEALGIHPGRLAIFSDRCCQPAAAARSPPFPPSPGTGASTWPAAMSTGLRTNSVSVSPGRRAARLRRASPSSSLGGWTG